MLVSQDKGIFPRPKGLFLTKTPLDAADVSIIVRGFGAVQYLDGLDIQFDEAPQGSYNAQQLWYAYLWGKCKGYRAVERGSMMENTEQDVFDKLEAAVSGWQNQISEVQEGLANRLAKAKEGLMAAVKGDLEAGAVQEQLADIRDTLHECAQATLAMADHVAVLGEAAKALHGEVASLRLPSGENFSGNGAAGTTFLQLVQEVRELSQAVKQLGERGEAFGAEVSQVRQERDEAHAELARVRSELERLQAGASPDASALPAGQDEKASASEAQAATERAEEVASLFEAFDTEGTRRRLGEILISAGIISPDQLKEALGDQEARPQQRLGAILVDKGYTKEEVVAQVVAAQLRLRFVRLEGINPDPEALQLVTGRLAAHRKCVPLDLDGDTLVIAMVNPLDLIAIEDVELATGKRVEPVVASPSAVADAIDRLYPSA